MRLLTQYNKESDKKYPKWVNMALDDKKAIIVFRSEVQEDGYVKINGKVVSPNGKFPSDIEGSYVISIIWCLTYNGTPIAEETQMCVPLEKALSTIKGSYITYEDEVEDPREDLTEFGEFGAQRVLHYTIFNAFGKKVKAETKIDNNPIGRKVISVDREEEIIDKEETSYRPSSAWGMGQYYKCTLYTRKITITRTFEDGEKDVKVIVCKDDRP